MRVSSLESRSIFFTECNNLADDDGDGDADADDGWRGRPAATVDALPADERRDRSAGRGGRSTGREQPERRHDHHPAVAR